MTIDLEKPLKVLKILQEKPNGKRFRTSYRINPWNPLSYVALVLGFIITLFLYGVVGVITVGKIHSDGIDMNKCKDYYLLKIQIYPDVRSKRHTGQIDHKKYAEMYESYMEFRDKFIEKVFNKPITWFYQQHVTLTYDVVKEYLEVWYQIKIGDHESHIGIYIPWKYPNLIQWVKDNRPKLPFSEPMKYNTWCINYMQQEFSRRNDSKKMQIEFEIKDGVKVNRKYEDLEKIELS